MPMLAERKTKSRLTLNPRGTLWTNDENKLGKKMLEKMGWSSGKGLGRNEQGIKNPIHVSGNSESKGVGYSGNNDSPQHYENFEDVLASLNSANNSESSNSESENDISNLKNVESLEMKSKNSRTRVHYSKFTRGKDLSLYNENDLACVLGTKKILKRKANNKRKSENPNENINAEEKSEKKDNYIYGGNLRDYFNQKMEELKRKRGEGLLGDEETPKREKRKSTSPPETPFPDLELEIEKNNFSFNLSVQEGDVKPESSSGSVSYPEAEDKNEDEVDDKIMKKKKKRKKSKKNKDIDKEESVSECPEEENHNETADEIYVEEPKRDEKKTKRKFKSDDAEEIHVSEKESKKKKKKKKKSHAVDEEYVSNCKSIEPQTHDDSELNIEDEIQSYSRIMNESYVKATSTAEKKKKKKRKEGYEETPGEKENDSVSRPLKKLRKLASEISLPDILKSSAEKIENENNANCELENQADVHKKTEGEEKANPKVKRKRSFKEMKTDFETKVKEKFKKVSKSELVSIEEEAVIEENKTPKSEANNSKILNLKVPVGYDNGEYIRSAPNQYKTVQFDIEKTFPNSNLEKIKGYFKS